jgi:hypothetical protein
MEMLGLPSQEGGGIGDELTAFAGALRFGWASWTGYRCRDMAKILPAIFFGHGNPVNAVLDNGYTKAWR